MITEQIADMINNRQYREETTPEIRKIAKENNIVIVFGASDDLCEFRGAIYDEIGAWEGTTAYLSKNGLLEHSECDDEECPYFKEIQQSANQIKVIWNDHGGWSFETEIPHHKFNVLEDERRYGEGIVFRMDDLK